MTRSKQLAVKRMERRADKLEGSVFHFPENSTTEFLPAVLGNKGIWFWLRANMNDTEWHPSVNALYDLHQGNMGFHLSRRSPNTGDLERLSFTADGQHRNDVLPLPKHIRNERAILFQKYRKSKNFMGLVEAFARFIGSRDYKPHMDKQFKRSDQRYMRMLMEERFKK